ncbi:MAG TPA: hypothetical protein DDY68_00990 [Porphyromonadaceae bacterium]|nr:hypothetical protein [Porphyromonadaceae bacterium]
MDRASLLAFKDLKAKIGGFFNTIKGSTKPIEDSLEGTQSLQSIKKQIIEELGSYGFFKRDDGQIIISAPKIIIGNVDRNGVLLAGGESKLVLRSSDISIEAPSNFSNQEGRGKTLVSGEIKLKSESIENEAVDPGLSGELSIVTDHSKIVNRAKSICLDGQDTGDLFMIDVDTSPGVNISSTGSITLKSGIKRVLKEKYDKLKEEVSNSISTLQTSINEIQGTFDDKLKKMEQLMDDTEELLGDDFGIANDCDDIDKNAEDYAQECKALRDQMAICEKSIQELAMKIRINNSLTDGELKEYSDTIPTEQGESSDGIISIIGDSIGMVASNGDEEETKTSNISMNAHTIRVGSSLSSSEDMAGSIIDMHTETINLDTVSSSSDGKSASIGSIGLYSKKIFIESADRDEEGNITPTPEGGLEVYADSVDITSQDTKEGKVAGTFTLNAKDILLKSVDQDCSSEDVKDKELVADGKIEFFAKNLQIGNIGEDEDKLKTEKVTILGKEILVDLKKSEDKFDLNQEDAPIAEITGSKTTIKSKEGFNIEEGDVIIKTNVTIEGKTEFKDNAKGTKIEAQNMEATQGIKSPKIDQ